MTHAANSLEHLPAEIGSMIVRRVPNIESLFALIAASPRMLRLYCDSRNEFYISVVKNEIGQDLLRQAMFLRKDSRPCYTLQDYIIKPSEPTIDDAKILYHEERLTCSIIQTCVDDELSQKVHLSGIEKTRLRRGFYNFRVAARLSQGVEIFMYDWQDISPFCQECTDYEILEMLYILYCLRNRFKARLSSLEDGILNALLHYAFYPDYDENHSIFSSLGAQHMFEWNLGGPWQYNIDFLHQECQVPANWTPEWSRLPEFEEDPVGIATLNNFIPVGHVFSDTEGNGFRWIQQCGPGYDYHYAIPLGFMIWDDERLKDMSWMSEPPPAEPVPEKWYISYQNHQTVEDRFDTIHEASFGTGKTLNTWLDQWRASRNKEKDILMT